MIDEFLKELIRVDDRCTSDISFYLVPEHIVLLLKYKNVTRVCEVEVQEEWDQELYAFTCWSYRKTAISYSSTDFSTGIVKLGIVNNGPSRCD